MCRRDGFMCFRQHQMQPFGVVARRFDPDIRSLHDPAAAALGPTLHLCPKIVARQIPLTVGPVEPLGRHPPVTLAPADTHLPATRPRRCDRIQNFHNAHRLSPATGAGSHSPSHQPVTGKPALLSLCVEMTSNIGCDQGTIRYACSLRSVSADAILRLPFYDYAAGAQDVQCMLALNLLYQTSLVVMLTA